MLGRGSWVVLPGEVTDPFIPHIYTGRDDTQEWKDGHSDNNHQSWIFFGILLKLYCERSHGSKYPQEDKAKVDLNDDIVFNQIF